MAYTSSSTQEALKICATWLGGEYKTIQTGRATPMVLDGVSIEQYGAWTPLAHVGSISIEDAKTLRVIPWDKSVIGAVEKAINDANLGLSVVSDSDGLRVIFPMLTTETRERYVKMLKEKLEDARVKVRAVREEANKEIDKGEKDGEYGQDERERYKDEVQKLVDGANAELMSLFEAKQKEVMGE
jgi:ribosome recycling factor